MTAKTIAVSTAMSANALEALMENAHLERGRALSAMLRGLPALIRDLATSPDRAASRPLRAAGAVAR